MHTFNEHLYTYIGFFYWSKSLSFNILIRSMKTTWLEKGSIFKSLLLVKFYRDMKLDNNEQIGWFYLLENKYTYHFLQQHEFGWWWMDHPSDPWGWP